LLTMSDKELKNILTDNILKAKYIIYDGSIYRVYRTKGLFILHDLRTFNYFNFKDNCKPLTYRLFKEIIKTKAIKDVKFSTFFKWCKNIFEESFGKDFVDAVKYNEKEYGRIYVHFPEITIKNSVEQEHIIRDLYLNFYIDKNRINIRGLKRATLTDSEYNNDYMFSHINTRTHELYRNNWLEEFCYGEGTSISNLVNSMRHGTKNIIKNLPFFLETIKEYLSWESLEGVPWRKIDSVLNDAHKWENIPDIDIEIYPIYEKVVSLLDGFDYEYHLGDNGWEIRLSSIDKYKVESLLENLYPEYLYPNLNGVSVTPKNQIAIERYKDEQFIYFKEEWRPFKLIDTEVVIPPMKIHSELLKEVVKEIEKEFTKFLTNKKIEEYV